MTNKLYDVRTIEIATELAEVSYEWSMGCISDAIINNLPLATLITAYENYTFNEFGYHVDTSEIIDTFIKGDDIILGMASTNFETAETLEHADGYEYSKFEVECVYNCTAERYEYTIDGVTVLYEMQPLETAAGDMGADFNEFIYPAVHALDDALGDGYTIDTFNTRGPMRADVNGVARWEV